jgi:hypothetical protein
MAGGQERILRGRIRSVQATKKITRAMELIAASRIVKAQQRVAQAVPYSEQITEVVKDLAAAGGASQSPLLAGRDVVRSTAYVVISADRGLCGGYNAGVQRATEGEIKAGALSGTDYSIVAIGRKAANRRDADGLASLSVGCFLWPTRPGAGAQAILARHDSLCAPTAFALCGWVQGLPPAAIRTDQLLVKASNGASVRLRFVGCPFAPFVDTSEQNVCQAL